MNKNAIQRRPKVPDDLTSLVKPEELVDIVEMTPLTLQDRRTYNLLLGNAWNDIFDRTKHTISRQSLTKHVDSHNQDIEGSLRRLMSSIVIIKIRNNKNGKPSTRQLPLLGSNEIEERGPIEYTFPTELIDIVKKTQIFARLHTEVMFALSSKYSLTLYEWLQKRVNLKFVHYEIISLKEMRAILGVPDGKLSTYGNFNKYAIKPATEEVSFLTDFEVIAEPIKTGRAVTDIKISWNRKHDVGAQIAAVEELERSKVGRKARMEGRGESNPASTLSQITNSSDIPLTSALMEQGKAMALKAGTGWDIYAIEREFQDYAKKKGKPDRPEGAFIKFVEGKIKQRP
jgi:hypothetical protein